MSEPGDPPETAALPGRHTSRAVPTVRGLRAGGDSPENKLEELECLPWYALGR